MSDVPVPPARAQPYLQPLAATLRDRRSVLLRRPTDDDAPGMIEYLDAVRRESPHIVVSPEDPLPTVEQEVAFIRSHAGADALLLLGEAQGRIVAIAGIKREGRVKTRHRAEVGISVLASWRGAGLGRVLLEELIAFAREHPGIHKVSLSVYADNAVARRLYAGCGFEYEGCRRGHIRQLDGHYCDEMLMGLWVKPGDAPGGA